MGPFIGGIILVGLGIIGISFMVGRFFPSLGKKAEEAVKPFTNEGEKRK